MEWKTLNAAQEQARKDMVPLYGTKRPLLKGLVGRNASQHSFASMLTVQVWNSRHGTACIIDGACNPTYCIATYILHAPTCAVADAQLKIACMTTETLDHEAHQAVAVLSKCIGC